MTQIKWQHTNGYNKKIDPMSVHVWLANFNDLSAIHKEPQKILLADELEHAAKFKNEKHANDFSMARMVLRIILGRYLNVEPNKIIFSYNDYGKPFLKGYSHQLHFNLSHSAGVALYIFSYDFEVGIDIEHIHPIENLLEIAKDFFSNQEFQELSELSIDKRLNSFFKCWTRKEAFIKALGNGLTHPLDKFEVSLKPNEIAEFTSIYGSKNLAKEWSLFSMQPLENYEAAFCFKGKTSAVNYWYYTG